MGGCGGGAHEKERVCIIPMWIVCSISLLVLFMHAGDKIERGGEERGAGVCAHWIVRLK